jgi:uncharacterized membrane protein YhhN
LSCATILLTASWFRWVLPYNFSSKSVDLKSIISAFVFSAAGDYFLTKKDTQPKGDESYFVLGVALYLIAHVGYLAFALGTGRVDFKAVVALALVFVPYGVFVLRPQIPDAGLFGAVFSYLVISCVVMATACGSQLPVKSQRYSFIFGISMILLSDTMISFVEFLQWRWTKFLILPTYYAAHVSITYVVLGLLKDVKEKSQ